MRKLMIWTALGLGAAAAAAAAAVMIPRMKVPAAPEGAKSLYDFNVDQIDGKAMELKKLKGKVVLVVNTASKCGLTPQYEGLEALYDKYKEKGLVIIGFPANDFAGQEPGTNEEIATFCKAKYDVSFPMMSKVTVVGEKMHPLYAWLINATDKKPIEWNFAKFLVGRDGKTIERFSSRTSPSDAKLVGAVESMLKVKVDRD
jgi:glutathione peroxidase